MNSEKPTEAESLDSSRHKMLGTPDRRLISRLFATRNVRNNRQKTDLSAICDEKCSKQPTKYRTLGCLRREMLGTADRSLISRLSATRNVRNSRQKTDLSAVCDVECSEQPTEVWSLDSSRCGMLKTADETRSNSSQLGSGRIML